MDADAIRGKVLSWYERASSRAAAPEQAGYVVALRDVLALMDVPVSEPRFRER